MFIPSINISNIFLFPYTGRENNNYSRKYNKCYWLIRIHDNIFDLHNFAIFRDGRNLFSSHDYNIIHKTTRDVIVIIFYFSKNVSDYYAFFLLYPADGSMIPMTILTRGQREKHFLIVRHEYPPNFQIRLRRTFCR